jgi:serine/threonine-protein kinase
MSDVPPTQAVSAELPPGAVLPGDRYRIRRVIGRGGTAITYEADDLRLGRLVAVKELFSAGAVRAGGVLQPPAHEADAFADARERFLREATVLARFNHPGIVRVFEVFEANGTAYLAMELLQGRTLHEYLTGRGRPFTESEARDLAARCIDALAVVHAAGVLHRDLNPANVILTDDGRVVLIDFGLARDFVADQTTPITRMVTPGYAPPEQYTGSGRLGPPTDVYGLAATLYRAVAGRAPANAPDRQAGAGLPAPHRLAPTCSRPFSDAILDGLELQFSHRPQTVDAFGSRLGLGADQPSTVAVPSAPDPTPAPIASMAAPVIAPAASVPRLPKWKLAVPALVAVGSIGAAAPVAGVALLAFVVLPAIATAGDAMVYVRMRRYEERLAWKHRVALGPYVPGRFVRNIAAVVYSGVLALLVLCVAVAVGLVVDTDTSDALSLRPGGALAAVLLTLPVFRNRYRFKAAVVADIAYDDALDDDGKLTGWGTGAWVVAALFALVAFGLRPDVWPLT